MSNWLHARPPNPAEESTVLRLLILAYRRGVGVCYAPQSHTLYLDGPGGILATRIALGCSDSVTILEAEIFHLSKQQERNAA